MRILRQSRKNRNKFGDQQNFNFNKMSFLLELQSKKAKLKPTTTTETYSDGSQRRIKCSLDGSIVDLGPSTSRQYGFVVDTMPDAIPACILSNFLYLGSQDAVTDTNIDEYKFTDILSIGIDTPPFEQNTDQPVQLHFVPCLDLPDTKLEDFIDVTMALIDSVRVSNPNGRILVHCNAGVSRSSTVCIAYLMKVERMGFQQAYDHVKSRRECIRPNDGFLKQLKEL